MMSLVDRNDYYDISNRHWATSSALCTSCLISSPILEVCVVIPTHLHWGSDPFSDLRSNWYLFICMNAENHILGWVPFPELMSPRSKSGPIIPVFQLRIPAWVLLIGVNLKIMWRLLLHMEPMKSVNPRGCLVGWKSRSRKVSIGLWKNVLSGNSQTS